jgi:hypothetical protein
VIAGNGLAAYFLNLFFVVVLGWFQVEIVMALEEEFKITVEEDNAQSITTIQEAADLIDKLVGEEGKAA